jgi:hypothetical protein
VIGRHVRFPVAVLNFQSWRRGLALDPIQIFDRHCVLYAAE